MSKPNKKWKNTVIPTGTKFGMLSVGEPTGETNKGGSVLYHCTCECGTERVYSSNRLLSESTRSCGCKGRTKTYVIWRRMLDRCLFSENKSFKDYGGRGITICPEWMDFEIFLKDMGEKPDGLSLDRIDVNGNYEQGNCRWADWNTQNQNRRNNKLTTELVDYIRNSPKRSSVIAIEIGVCPETVSRTRRGIRWSNKEEENYATV